MRPLAVAVHSLALAVVLPAMLMAQGNSWVQWSEDTTTGDRCGSGAWPGEDVTQSKTWHAQFRNTCWEGSQVTWLSADPTQTATGECIGPETGCYPQFQAYGSCGTEGCWWEGTAADQDFLGFCRESIVHTIRVTGDAHTPTDPPCPTPGVACGGSYCVPDQQCCNDGCVPSDAVCCDGGYCSSGSQCCGSGCNPAGTDCCGDGQYCSFGSLCCDDGGGGCCDESTYCCFTDEGQPACCGLQGLQEKLDMSRPPEPGRSRTPSLKPRGGKSACGPETAPKLPFIELK